MVDMVFPFLLMSHMARVSGSDTPLIYRAVPSWFVKVRAVFGLA